MLNRHGEVSPGWRAASGDLPPTPEAVQVKVREEGVVFDDDRASQDQRWTTEDWAASQGAGAAGDGVGLSGPRVADLPL